jgi:prevent-host-death family protein
MSIQLVTSREFTRDVAAAKRAAAERGPVVITERGQQTHVLLAIADYRRLAGQQQSMAQALAMPAGGDIVFEPPPMDVRWRIPDFGAEDEARR